MTIFDGMAERICDGRDVPRDELRFRAEDSPRRWRGRSTSPTTVCAYDLAAPAEKTHSPKDVFGTAARLAQSCDARPVMGWKSERWLSQVFPGVDRVFTEYQQLPPRELVIVAGSILDSALLELLSLRLVGSEKLITAFLGANDDGRAPARSFGARIDLCVLVGVLDDEDALVLREVKNLRNKMAHRVKVQLTAHDVFPHVEFLFKSLVERFKTHSPKDVFGTLERTESDAQKVVLLTLGWWQLYLNLLHPSVSKLQPIR